MAKLANAPAFFAANRHRLLVLDEIQNQPQILSELRGEIDADRRPGRFLLLGSASFKLLKQSQSLAGRWSLVDTSALLVSEATRTFADVQTLWLRGGFPNSHLAKSGRASWDWREALIRHFLNTDLPALGINVEPQLMQRYWRMVAHGGASSWPVAQCLGYCRFIGDFGLKCRAVSGPLCDTLMVRRLEPYFINLGKRLVKSPKVYVRDSGLLHSLLGIREVNDLLGHPSTGASWEGFVVEQIANHLPPGANLSFYRTIAGAEMDVVVELGQNRIGFEVKFSSAPKVTKGFWQAAQDLKLSAAYVVAPVQEGWPLQGNASVISVTDIPERLQRMAQTISSG